MKQRDVKMRYGRNREIYELPWTVRLVRRYKAQVIVALVLIGCVIYYYRDLKIASALYVGFQKPTTKDKAGLLSFLENGKFKSDRSNAESDKYTAEQTIEDHALGIPYVNIDLSNPYIPNKRIVHLDLKGAPPIVNYFKKFFLMIRNMGATGILIEYEDMLPFEGPLKTIAAKNAYTKEEIGQILKFAQDANLEVIPLIQTFGHLEFALKYPEYEKLREVPNSPQALCPSRNGTLEFLMEMVHQVLKLHPKIKFLHIGCDEVFQMGECDLCRVQMHEALFLNHVQRVAKAITKHYPNINLIIWDDMLRHLSEQSMIEMKLGELIQPMIWVYAEDIYHFVQTQVWEKYAVVFKTAWTASAFKGAFGESLYVPEAKRHLENNLRWLEVMSQQSKHFKHGFAGIALTGWQRYDHFAVLCELLPAAIPSLALNLFAVTNGYFNASLKKRFLAALSCPQSSGRYPQFMNLDADSHMWEKLNRCMFPGSGIFRLTYRLNVIETEVLEFLQSTKRQKGWMTEYNIRRNFTSPLRIEELTGNLPRIYHGVISLAKSSVEIMTGVFDNYTIAEWIEQRMYSYIMELERLLNDSLVLRNIQTWPTRPLPILSDFDRLGIILP